MVRDLGRILLEPTLELPVKTGRNIGVNDDERVWDNFSLVYVEIGQGRAVRTN